MCAVLRIWRLGVQLFSGAPRLRLNSFLREVKKNLANYKKGIILEIINLNLFSFSNKILL
tara:strand:+ start:964 stop:1143 length:180 start_codon:yes stop_codon:yes gene_type:complete